MAPGPKTFTPAEMADQLGVEIRPNEVAYREGKAFVLFTTPAAPAASGKPAPASEGSGIVVPGGQGPSAAAFLNPVQEFNRDLSICAIRTWQADMQAERQHRRQVAWAQKQAALERKASKRKARQAVTDGTADEESASAPTPSDPPQLPVQRFTVLEALAASGLRSIRYAKEIDTIRSIVANDISASAVEAMRRNVELNFPETEPDPNATSDVAAAASGGGRDGDVDGDRAAGLGASAESKLSERSKIQIREGDALSVMYAHRTNDMGRFDVIDLDPYGSASMFLDATVQAVADGGLLCVTCTDLAVLAGGQYPEKSFTLYGGMNLRAEHSHELALRLLLHAIAANAARYGRVIQPVLSLSIDFYVRVFVRVYSSVQETKHLASQSALSWTCQSCSHTLHMPMARVRQGPPAKNGQEQIKFTTAGRPPCSGQCDLCGGSFLMAGPYWSGPLHDRGFCTRLLDLVQRDEGSYRTSPRIIGMVSTAAEELGTAEQIDPRSATSHVKLPSVPASRPGEEADVHGFISTSSERSLFYFTSAQVSRAFHGTSAPLPIFVHALLHAGYQVSRSHCLRGSMKTNAPYAVVHDIYRYWLRQLQDKEVEEEAKAAAAAAADGAGEDAKGSEDTEAAAKAAASPAASLVGRTIEMSKRVKAQNERAPAYILSCKAIERDWNLHPHPDSDRILLPQLPGAEPVEARVDATGGQVTPSGEHFHRKVGPRRTRIVRYQENPLPNWGPATAARMTPGPAKSKRARGNESPLPSEHGAEQKRAREA